jgi:hypothetical protein
MARATLKISADGSSVKRVLERIPVLAEAAAEATRKAFAVANKKAVHDWDAWAREVERATQRAQKAVAASVLRQQRDMDKLAADAAKREQEKTRVTDAETTKRARFPYREADENEKAKPTRAVARGTRRAREDADRPARIERPCPRDRAGPTRGGDGRGVARATLE